VETKIIIVVLTATITFWSSVLYINKKIDILINKIERRNSKESKNRLLYRHDD